jgi:hypothetical protein
MTARVIPITRSAGRGRQPVQVEQLRDTRDELRALVLEGVELAARLLLIIRRAERTLAGGRSCATDLDELERLALRHGTRMAAAAIDADLVNDCPDAVEHRALNHGRAA